MRSSSMYYLFRLCQIYTIGASADALASMAGMQFDPPGLAGQFFLVGTGYGKSMRLPTSCWLHAALVSSNRCLCCLSAIGVLSTTHSYFYPFIFPGGAFNYDLMSGWLNQTFSPPDAAKLYQEYLDHEVGSSDDMQQYVAAHCDLVWIVERPLSPCCNVSTGRCPSDLLPVFPCSAVLSISISISGPQRVVGSPEHHKQHH